MLTNLKKTKSEGFTIIEVMIVLAIAGLIILIVLLAVPALQRNARNTAIKNDASAVAGGISESESNNDGTSPTNVAGTGTVNITNGSSTTAKVQGSTAVSYTAATGGAPAATGPTAGTIVVLAGHKCEKAGTYTAGVTGDTNARSFAIYYSTETSGGTTQKCLDT
jgi:prepilin-type N-terminal cleavage/methylation domain-containing protein